MFIKRISKALSHQTIYKLVCVSLQWENEITRCPGFWKLNNSLLKDENYIKQICKPVVSRIPKETQRYYRYANLLGAFKNANLSIMPKVKRMKPERTVKSGFKIS